MTVTREELAAFADGELDPARAAEVEAALAADPALAEAVRAHRALRERLGARFAPIMDEPVPERLTVLLDLADGSARRHEPPASAGAHEAAVPPGVIDFAAARERRKLTLPRWSWVVGPALAASLVLAVFLPRGSEDYASGALAQTLDGQLVATQAADAPTRILLSFRDEAGSYCRAFAGEARSGIACRDGEGWRLRMSGAGVSAQQTDFRMAGNPAAEVLEQVQAMAAGPALDAAAEEAARARGWR